MNKLTQQLKTTLIRSFLNAPIEKLDDHYITSSKGSFTRKQLANEIENETEIGLQQMESILKLTIHLLERGREKI